MVGLETAITSGKKKTSLEDTQEDPTAGIQETSKQDAQQVLENGEMDVVEGLAPFETVKGAAYGGALATPGDMAPTDDRETLDNGDTSGSPGKLSIKLLGMSWP
jgi:hypothetical protein